MLTKASAMDKQTSSQQEPRSQSVTEAHKSLTHRLTGQLRRASITQMLTRGSFTCSLTIEGLAHITAHSQSGS